MNAAFEDCAVFDRLIDRRGIGAGSGGDDWAALFAELQALRKPNTDVLAALSVENFHELRDTVRRPIVTAKKRTAIFFNRLFRQHSVPLYTMISHSTMPYAEAVDRHRRQERIARWLGLDLVVGAVSLNVRLRTALAQRRAARLAAARGPQETVVQTVALPLPGTSEEEDKAATPEPEVAQTR
jgi:kynurenine 3-monooxygenase